MNIVSNYQPNLLNIFSKQQANLIKPIANTFENRVKVLPSVGFITAGTVLAIQNGYIVDDNPSLRDAQFKNPAPVIANKIINKAIKEGEFDDKGMRFNTPEALDAELCEAELNQNIQQDTSEVLSLIINGKLNEKLTQRYDKMGKIFEGIIEKRTPDIDKLALECERYKKTLPPDTLPEVAEQQKCQKYAEGILSIFAEELGIKGYEPQIIVEGEGSVSNCSMDGVIRIGKGVLTKNYTQIIAHELIHSMQYMAILADHGIDGLVDIIKESKAISADKKQAFINEILNSQYLKKLLESGILKKSEKGSINEYLRKIYIDEEIDYKTIENPATATQEDVDNYANQVVEREAYWGGNGHSRLVKTVGLEALTLKDFEEAKLKYNLLSLQEDNTLAFYNELSGEFQPLGKINPEDTDKIKTELAKIKTEKRTKREPIGSWTASIIFNEETGEFEPQVM